MPHPKTDFSINQIASDDQSYGPRIHERQFSKRDFHSDDFELRNPAIHSENILA